MTVEKVNVAECNKQRKVSPQKYIGIDNSFQFQEYC